VPRAPPVPPIFMVCACRGGVSKQRNPNIPKTNVNLGKTFVL
jgi:hypothetical protein